MFLYPRKTVQLIDLPNKKKKTKKSQLIAKKVDLTKVHWSYKRLLHSDLSNNEIQRIDEKLFQGLSSLSEL